MTAPYPFSLPPSVNTTSPPAAVAVTDDGGVLYIVYKGVGDTSNIWWVRTDGSAWTGITALPSTITTGAAPGAAILGGVLYVFFLGVGDDQNVYVTNSSEPDSGTWSDPLILASDAQTGGAITAHAYGPSIYVLFQKQNSAYVDGVIYGGIAVDAEWATMQNQMSSFAQQLSADADLHAQFIAEPTTTLIENNVTLGGMSDEQMSNFDVTIQTGGFSSTGGTLYREGLQLSFACWACQTATQLALAYVGGEVLLATSGLAGLLSSERAIDILADVLGISRAQVGEAVATLDNVTTWSLAESFCKFIHVCD